MDNNPLLAYGHDLCARAKAIKEAVKQFYFAVLLSKHSCPECAASLSYSGPSQCRCSNGHLLDPTEAFVRCACGKESTVVRRGLRYVCKQCGQPVVSPFLFEERIYDPEYFRERMQKSRERAQKRKVRVQRMLQECRSGAWQSASLEGDSNLQSLFTDLDALVVPERDPLATGRDPVRPFDLEQYRAHVRSSLAAGEVLLRRFPALIPDPHRDCVRCFITLLHMETEGECTLTSLGDDILVEAPCR